MVTLSFLPFALCRECNFKSLYWLSVPPNFRDQHVISLHKVSSGNENKKFILVDSDKLWDSDFNVRCYSVCVSLQEPWQRNW